MGKITISLSKWITLSSQREARSIHQTPGSNYEAAPVAAAPVGGNVTSKDARLVYIERAIKVALLLLDRLQNRIEQSSSQPKKRAAEDSSSGAGGDASILIYDIIAIENFAVAIEFEDTLIANRLIESKQKLSDIENQNGHHYNHYHDVDPLELCLVTGATPCNINFSNSFQKVDQEDQILMLSESDAQYFVSIGLLLYKLFCRGESPPSQLELNNGVSSDQPSRDSIAESMAHKKLNKADNHSYEQLFSKYDIPRSICRLLSDLIQTGEASVENPFESLGDISLELNQISERPNEFLHPTKNTIMDQPNFGEVVYGRSSELHSLLNVAARLPVERNPLENKIVLISGHSGSGKSFLVNSVLEPLRNMGYMQISAKFDRLAQHSALSTIVSAFDEFFEFIADLRRSPDVDDTAEDIVLCMERDLGASGIVMLSNLMPSIRNLFPHILRRVVSDPDLSAMDENHNQPTHNPGQGNVILDEEDSAPSAEFSRNRLQNLFRRLFNAISSPEHPICFWLDDLQWTDHSSMDLISSLLLDFDHLDHFGNIHPPSQCFFVVGTYRDNEVTESHIFTSCLEKLEESNSVAISKINLGGMRNDSANLMISKALQLPLRLTRTLTDATMAKTAGNPFHMKAFVKSLIQEKVLHWSLLEKRWVWDIEAVRAISIDESVAELLARNLLQLSDFVREALKVASCFGSEISDSMVRRLSSSKEWERLVDGLDSAVAENILEKRQGGRYKFVHDLLQEASYDLMDEEERSKFHYSIGMHLISNMPQPEDPAFSSVSFDAIGQINRVETFASAEAFRVQFATLNLKAGKRSMEVSDFVSALSYMEYGRAFLPEGVLGWEENYELCLGLCENAAIACFVLALVDKMKVFLKEVFEHTNCLEDKLKGYYLLIRSMAALSLNGATEKVLSILNALGEEFPDPSGITPDLIRNELMSTSAILKDLTKEDVLTPRRMSEASKQYWAVKYMAIFIMFLAVNNQRYLPLAASRMIKISASHGYINDSAFGFIVFGQAIISLSQDLDNGYRLGKMALALLEGLNSKDARPRVKWWFCSMLAFWKEPIQAINSVLRENIDESLKVGDNEYAVLSCYTLCRNNLFSGENLSSAAKEVALATSMSSRLQQLNMHLALLSQHLSVLKLMGSDQDPLYGDIPIKNEDELLRYVISKGKTAATRVQYLTKMFVAFWFKNYQEAVDMEAKCDALGVFSYADVVMHAFYKGLISFHLARSANDDREKHLEGGRKSLLLFQVWVKEKHASTWNFEHKLYILEAEWHFSNGDQDEAEEKYAAAIETARKHRFVNEEGLAYELCSDLHTAFGNIEKAKSHILEARACYEKWGALALVKLIDDKINV